MRLFGVVACLVSLVIAGPAAASGWISPDAAYSATRTLRAGGMEMAGPLHYDDGKERFEVSMEGSRQIMIRREDRQRFYMVMPEMGMAMEMAIDGAEGMPSARDYADQQPESLGRETLDGEAVTKYRVEAGEGGERYTMFVWVTDDGIPLRMEGASAEGSFEMVLSDLERGPQPAELFELPAGIQVMAVPGQ